MGLICAEYGTYLKHTQGHLDTTGDLSGAHPETSGYHGVLIRTRAICIEYGVYLGHTHRHLDTAWDLSKAELGNLENILNQSGAHPKTLDTT